MNSQQEEQEIGAAEAGGKFPSQKTTQASVSLRKNLLFVFSLPSPGSERGFSVRPLILSRLRERDHASGCAPWLLWGSLFLGQDPLRSCSSPAPKMTPPNAPSVVFSKAKQSRG